LGHTGFSVVVPVYNEEGNLKTLHESICDVMSHYGGYEIIYADDGSSDSSKDILHEIQKSNPGITVITHPKNKGQSRALWSGLEKTQGEWVVTLDADLQNPPGEIAKFLEFKNDYDFITGIRRKRKDSLFKKIASGLAHMIRFVVLRDTTSDTGCSLRMFRKSIFENTEFFEGIHRFMPYIARTKGARIKEVPVEHHVRLSGNSKYGGCLNGYLKRARDGLKSLIHVHRHFCS